MARALILAFALLALFGVLSAQRPFRQFPAPEGYTDPPPPDWNVQAEWTFGRLIYPWNGWGMPYGLDWRTGPSHWGIDYPRSDRHIVAALRRLTRIHARAVEQPINIEEGDQFDWPWLYAVEVGHWELNDQLAKGLREYLLRGGFMMVDDFHGDQEWENFMQGVRMIFPDRKVIDIPDDDSIFHTVYNLENRFQVPGAQFIYSGTIPEKGRSGSPAHWRAIYDDYGRIMIAICHNMDLGDSIEWADRPEYPAKFSDMGFRIVINYAIYGMTH